MTAQKFARLRPYFTALVLIAELAHIAWEHFNGGVVSHNILNRPDLPAISNWWGVILLPALAWFLTGRVQRRIARQTVKGEAEHGFPVSILVGFILALVFGAALAFSFTHGYSELTSYLFRGMLLLAILLPVYRAECVLGFVLGMTFTFGAILPTAVATVIAALSAFVHLVLWRGVTVLWSRFRPV